MARKFSTAEEKVFIADLAFPDYKDLQEARQLVDDCPAGQTTIKSKEKHPPLDAAAAERDGRHRQLTPENQRSAA